MLSTNHLDVKKPAPQLWTTWDDDMTIADIVSMQDYKLPRGTTCYPVTLIYYPKQRDPDTYTERSFSLACGDDTLLPGASSTNPHEELWVPDLPEGLPQDPPTATETSANAEASHGHKRTISEVVPRGEREAEREIERGNPQEQAHVDGDGEVNEIAQGGVRRSGRGPKPSKRR
jgi:hypothetical protein